MGAEGSGRERREVGCGSKRQQACDKTVLRVTLPHLIAPRRAGTRESTYAEAAGRPTGGPSVHSRL